ncbi:tail fiber domain-containing protein [Sandaracinomonas limnophila]|nr:tail fiber domain-containing protein [Sandaracinomonas limnophila]
MHSELKLRIFGITTFIFSLITSASLAQNAVVDRYGKEITVGSNFSLSGGTTDAGTDKTNAIYRLGNLGIGTNAPANKLEINQGTAGNSGLRFTNLTSSSTANTSSSKVLGVDSNGDVILTNVPGTQNIVTFSTATPTTSGVVFTPDTPSDQSVVYQSSVDNSLWTYNGTTYVTYTAPASTAWNLAGTTNDAGSNKTASIWRGGSVGIGGNSFTPSVPLEVQSSTVGPFTTVARFFAPTNTTAGHATQLNFGTANAKGNSSEWRFVYQGNDAANNRVDFGMNGYVTPMINYLRSGNVGIGISTPVATLDVNSQTAATQAPNVDVTILKLSRPTSSGSKFGNVAQFNLGTYAQLGATAYSRMDLTMNDGLDITTMSPVMTWQANGFVGVGINTPTINLDVKGGGSFRNGNDSGVFTKNQLLFGYNSTSNYAHAIKTRHQGGAAAGNAIDFYTWTNANAASAIGTKHVFTIDGSGRVGVGTTSPTSTIHAINSLSATNTVNADAQMLRFSRPAVNGVKWDNIAQFDLGTYGTTTFASSRLDLGLTDGDNNTVISKVMTWQGNGNVGIGTTAPLTKLVVNDNAYIASLPTTSTNLMDNSTFRPLIRFQTTSGVNNNSISYYLTTSSAAVQAHNYSTGNVLPYIIQPAGGNVGIGTNSPESLFHVKGATGGITLERTAGTAPYDQAFIKMINKDGGSFQLRNISGTSDGFTLTNGLASTNYITGLSTGNIGIGTTTPGYKLDVSGDINASGSVRAAGTALTSDLRLKSNIVNLNSGLTKIMQLRPVNYDKKMSLDAASNSINENGFIAQELQKVMPELVSEGKDKDKLLSVNYTAIIPVLTKAIQEQQIQIENNQALIQKQQNQINELKELVEKLVNKK